MLLKGPSENPQRNEERERISREGDKVNFVNFIFEGRKVLRHRKVKSSIVY